MLFFVFVRLFSNLSYKNVIQLIFFLFLFYFIPLFLINKIKLVNNY